MSCSSFERLLVRMKIKLRTLFILTALIALVSLCNAPILKSPLPSAEVQFVYPQIDYPFDFKPIDLRREDDIVNVFYASLFERLKDDPQINLTASARPIADLRRIIRVTYVNKDLNSTIIKISAWRTPIVSKLDDLKVILGVACEVVQDIRQPGIGITFLEYPAL